MPLPMKFTLKHHQKTVFTHCTEIDVWKTRTISIWFHQCVCQIFKFLLNFELGSIQPLIYMLMQQMAGKWVSYINKVSNCSNTVCT